MFAVKYFWKFQGVREKDIGIKYLTNAQRSNFQKDPQSGWIAAARATGFVAPWSNILFQYFPSSRLAIHLAALATNMSLFIYQTTRSESR